MEENLIKQKKEKTVAEIISSKNMLDILITF